MADNFVEIQMKEASILEFGLIVNGAGIRTWWKSEFPDVPPGACPSLTHPKVNQALMTCGMFVCSVCEEVFSMGWTNEDAKEHYRKMVGKAPPENASIACSECMKKMVDTRN